MVCGRAGTSNGVTIRYGGGVHVRMYVAKFMERVINWPPSIITWHQEWSEVAGSVN